MAKGNWLRLELTVNNYTTPATEEVGIKFPSRLRRICDEWIMGRLRARVAQGIDIDGQPFAPLSDGTPTTVTKSGSMINELRSATSSELKRGRYGLKLDNKDMLAEVGITEDNGQRYPWVIHFGRHRRGMRSSRQYYMRQMRTIAYLSAKFARATTDKGRRFYQAKIHAAQMRAKAANETIADKLGGKSLYAAPPRAWFGLLASEIDQINAAVLAWVRDVIEGAVEVHLRNATVDQVNQVAEQDLREELG